MFAADRAYISRYGRINGVHCAENPTLLKDILRKEWGFDGIVISDWCVALPEYHLRAF